MSVMQHHTTLSHQATRATGKEASGVEEVAGFTLGLPGPRGLVTKKRLKNALQLLFCSNNYNLNYIYAVIELFDLVVF